MSKNTDLPEQVRNRMAKAAALREMGYNPYRNDFKPTATTKDVKDYYHWKPTGELDDKGKPVMKCGRHLTNKPGAERFSLAGRIILHRSFGKSMFAHIRDRYGDIQIFVSKAELGDEGYKLFKKAEVGDIVAVSGACFLTRTGELTVHANDAFILTKSLRPLPEKFHGLTDIEMRYRQRYVDLIANPDVMETFRKRTQIMQEIRNFLNDRDFMEVETPMLHPLIGGAAARPFETHHNALDRDLYLRIAPELYLKRLLVGGFERVYEINRNFRNEGISTKHNPEFTMLEFYWAYATFEDLISFTEQMISTVTEKVCGDTKVNYQGTELNFSAPWNRMTMNEAVVFGWNKRHEDKAIELEMLDDKDAFDAFLRENFTSEKGDFRFEGMEHGECIGVLFEEVAEDLLIQPTFITQYPTAISPLARKNEENADYTDRFEIFVYGRELGNAFSELNDPEDQRQRFQAQVEKKSQGMDETMDYDEDYITALEYGMPPAAGEGIGIDRLCMFLCDAASIRDVILFPQLKN